MPMMPVMPIKYANDANDAKLLEKDKKKWSSEEPLCLVM
jgi:hypothetical protein